MLILLRKKTSVQLHVTIFWHFMSLLSFLMFYLSIKDGMFTVGYHTHLG